MKNGITSSMQHLNCQEGVVKIDHKIYGKQNIDTIINLIDDENKVGVYIGNQQIYLGMDEIRQVRLSKKSAFISGDMMQIEILIK